MMSVTRLMELTTSSMVAPAWSTSVVVPPDGDMANYRASLALLQDRDDRIYYPAHGPAIEKPRQLVRGMIGHRLLRERQILRLLGEDPRAIAALAAPLFAAGQGVDAAQAMPLYLRDKVALKTSERQAP